MSFCRCIKCYSVTTLLIIGIIFFCFAIGSLIFVPKLVDKAIRENVFVGRYQNGSDNIALKQYRDPDYDIKMQIWVVSVQNPAEVVNNGAKANVTELGPFTYDIRLHKQNLTFDGPNESRLFYRNVKSFFFNPDLSCSECQLSASVTVPNIIFQKLVDVFENNPFLIRIIEPFLVDKENVFVTVSVDELLFKGYEDTLIRQICASPFTKSICERNKVPERIGLFYGQNGTDDGLYEVDTGKGDADRIGHVYSWNGMKGQLDDTHWFGEGARLISGTDGQLFRPDLGEEQKLQVFLGSLCRSFDLEFDHSLTFYDLPVRRFVLPASLFSSQIQRSQDFCNPNSAEYFQNESVQEAGCAPSGLLDMSTCLPGQPRIFLSAAHFRGAVDELRHSIDGFGVQMADGENRTEMEDDGANLGFFDIMPLTGCAVRVQQQFQMSLGMLRGHFRMTRNMRNFVMPMVRMVQIATVDASTKAQLLLPVKALRFSFIGAIVLISLGTILTIASVGLAAFFIVKSEKTVRGGAKTPPAGELTDDFEQNGNTIRL